jgi:hypothetical protein
MIRGEETMIGPNVCDVAHFNLNGFAKVKAAGLRYRAKRLPGIAALAACSALAMLVSAPPSARAASGVSWTAGGPLTIAPDPLTQALNITQTSPTSGSTTGPYAGSITGFTFSQAVSGSGNDAFGLQTGYVAGQRWNCTYGGASLNITGTIGGYTCGLFAQTLTSTANPAGDKMTVVSAMYSNVSDTSGYGLYPLVTSVLCDTSCVTTDEVAADLDVSLKGSTTRRHGVRIAISPGSSAQASTLDAGLAFANAGTAQSAGWQHLIALSSSGFTSYGCSPNACSPITSTGDWFYSEGNYTINHWANLANLTVNGYILDFPNLTLSGSGNASGVLLDITNPGLAIRLNQQAGSLTPVNNAALQVIGANGSSTGLDMITFANSWSNATYVNGRVAGGTPGSPTATPSVYTALSLTGQGYDGASWASGAAVGIHTQGNWTGSNHGMYVAIYTTAQNSTTITATAYFSGGVTVGSSAATTATGEFAMNKISDPGTAPGAGQVKLTAEAGTSAGTCKIVARAGTSTTATTLLDNIGGSC